MANAAPDIQDALPWCGRAQLQHPSPVRVHRLEPIGCIQEPEECIGIADPIQILKPRV
jgi:hypothetical protein